MTGEPSLIPKTNMMEGEDRLSQVILGHLQAHCGMCTSTPIAEKKIGKNLNNKWGKNEEKQLAHFQWFLV